MRAGRTKQKTQKLLTSARMTLLCVALVCCTGVLRAEQPTTVPHVAETPWTGPNSPFVFEDGVGGARTVKIGNESYLMMTLDQLANDPNPGLTNRNVAVISESLFMHDEPAARRWTVWLGEKPAMKLTHADRFYEDGLKMLETLRNSDPALVLGTAQPDGKGSTLQVSRIYRIPSEIIRLGQDFDLLKQHPDYEAYKTMANSLYDKIAVARKKDDTNAADKLTELRNNVVFELLAFRQALLKAHRLSIEEENEFMDSSLKYAPTDRDAAGSICKDILRQDPDNKHAIEAVKVLAPDWVRCSETKTWMSQAECEKRRQDEIHRIDDQRAHAQQDYINHLTSVAGMSRERHHALLKNQAMLADRSYKLPAETEDDWKNLTKVLSSSDDFRLVQEIMLQCVTQLDRPEWARLVPSLLASSFPEIRVLGFRLGAFSNDRNTVLSLAVALVDDKSDALKEDAILAMCESRTPLVVQALVQCMERNHNDDHLNQILLQQLQALTHFKASELADWQKYAQDASKITIVAE